jgi:hypothetical protein
MAGDMAFFPSLVECPASVEVNARADTPVVREGNEISDARDVVVARADMTDQRSGGVYVSDDGTGTA